MTTSVSEPVTDVASILSKYPEAKRDALIPILQDVQETHGYLSRSAIVQIGAYLNLPVSKIFGVATFYNQFRFQPLGKHHIQVCRGTACHVKGSLSVLDAVQQDLRIAPGQTTRDCLFSLEVVSCVGACGLAPVMCIDGEFHAGLTAAKARNILETYREEAADHE